MAISFISIGGRLVGHVESKDVRLVDGRLEIQRVTISSWERVLESVQRDVPTGDPLIRFDLEVTDGSHRKIYRDCVIESEGFRAYVDVLPVDTSLTIIPRSIEEVPA